MSYSTMTPNEVEEAIQSLALTILTNTDQYSARQSMQEAEWFVHECKRRDALVAAGEVPETGAYDPKNDDETIETGAMLVPVEDAEDD